MRLLPFDSSANALHYAMFLEQLLVHWYFTSLDGVGGGISSHCVITLVWIVELGGWQCVVTQGSLR